MDQGIWKGLDEIKDPKLRRNAASLPTLIKNAFAQSTLKKYEPAWKKWITWTRNFQEVEYCPADPLHVALYFTISPQMTVKSVH